MHGSKKGMTAKSVVPIRQRSYKWADFKVSDYLMDADEEVIRDLAKTLFSKISGSENRPYSDAMRDWVTAPEFAEFKQPIYLRRSRNITRSPVGEERDLNDSMKRLKSMDLATDIPDLYLTWTKEPNVRRVGYCSVLMKVVAISSVFDSPDVPEFVLDYALYHEYLHVKVGFDPSGDGRNADFIEEEKKFPKWAEAENWINKLCLYL